MKKPVKVTKAHREKKIKEAIKLLNDIVKIKIAPSQVHGVGVFALRDMKKGEKLYADAIPHAFDVPYSKFKLLRPEIRDIILGHWPQIINGSYFLYPVTRMVAFMNHADNHNYDGKADKLIKDVKAGDEITENYREIPNYEKVFAWLTK